MIGGGLTGAHIALWLCRAGLRVILLEAETLGSGASRVCAGAVSAAGGFMYAQTERVYGEEAAASLGRTQAAAMQSLRELAAEPGYQGGWRDADAFVVCQEEKRVAALEHEARALERAGIRAEITQATQCPVPVAAALRVPDQGALLPMDHLHSVVRMATGLGLAVFEHSRVVTVEDGVVYTRHGSVSAAYRVVATGYPIVNTPGWYFMRMEQRPGWLMPLEQPAAFDGLYLDAIGRFGVRPLHGRALLWRVSDKATGRAPKEPLGDLAAPERLYSGVEAYTADGLPYIGPYGKSTPNLFVAAGFNGRGIVSGIVAAQAISARVLGLSADDYAVYIGRRGGMRSLALETKTAMAVSGRFLQGELHPRAPRCTHMGCRLRYNARANLWECPCHGSRFSDIGRVIRAPAVREANIRHGRR